MTLHGWGIFKYSVALALLTGRCIVELLAYILVSRHDLLDLVVVGQELGYVHVALTQWIERHFLRLRPQSLAVGCHQVGRRLRNLSLVDLMRLVYARILPWETTTCRVLLCHVAMLLGFSMLVFDHGWPVASLENLRGCLVKRGVVQVQAWDVACSEVIVPTFQFNLCHVDSPLCLHTQPSLLVLYSHRWCFLASWACQELGGPLRCLAGRSISLAATK